MAQASTRNAARRKRHARIRLTVAGTPARPRQGPGGRHWDLPRLQQHQGISQLVIAGRQVIRRPADVVVENPGRVE